MVDGKLMNVNKSLKRSGSEVQEIVNNFIFLDTASGNVVELFDHKWFMDSLEEMVKLIKSCYDDFKICLAYFDDGGDDKSFVLAILVVKSKYKCRKAELESEVTERVNGISEVPVLFVANEIRDDRKFKDICSGRIFDMDDIFN